MYQIDFNKPSHVHFIGIGGISMSGLAEILLEKGFQVSGSDSKETPLTRTLSERGIRVFYGQRADNISPETDLVVYTAAIHPDNPEYAKACEMQIPMLTRAELLGQIMKNYRLPIAVAGTHGKTTTTSMLSQILLEADTDPTISVGGILPSIGGNIRVGHSDYFVTEACEYTNSFLSFFPLVGIILNMDADHLDFFKDIDDIRHSFHRFAKLIPSGGTLIISADTPAYETIIEDLPCRVIFDQFLLGTVKARVCAVHGRHKVRVLPVQAFDQTGLSLLAPVAPLPRLHHHDFFFAAGLCPVVGDLVGTAAVQIRHAVYASRAGHERHRGRRADGRGQVALSLFKVFRPAGLHVCRHHHEPARRLHQPLLVHTQLFDDVLVQIGKPGDAVIPFESG